MEGHAAMPYSISRRGPALATLPPIGLIVASLAERLGVGEFATGGLQLAVLGGLVAVGRYFGGTIYAYIKKRIVVTAEFDSRDESYSWILNWLTDHPYSTKATQFSVSTSICRAGQRLTGEGLDAHLPPVYFLPAPGFHLFTYHSRILWLSRDRVSKSASAASGTNAPLETIKIGTFGRSRHILERLVFEAQKKYIDRDQSRTVVYAADQYGAWRRTRSRPKRPLSTIVIPSSIKRHLLHDAHDFLRSEQWYSDRGIPYRRGYLLYGTPGSGKTSFIHALAGELGLNIYVINLSNKSLTDDTLAELVTDTPTRCLLLIEDVDAAFVQRVKGQDVVNNITFSGKSRLLNAIDGVAAQEGRILCMTTNHIDRLDPALIRPGRIDLRVEFTRASKEQARELFERFYPPPPSEEEEEAECSAEDEIAHVERTSAVESKLISPWSQELVQEPETMPPRRWTLDRRLTSTAEMLDPTPATSRPNSPSPRPMSSANRRASRMVRRQSVAATPEQADLFASMIPNDTFSMAALQGFLMEYKSRPELAIAHVSAWVEQNLKDPRTSTTNTPDPDTEE
ncbi:hypothetical protein BZG36_01175 [Bifiguratus adelaidae]|uniref:BCS1 N-terminal domain-containing protein n=1 Tax=Bifiguratus adelaidae TaxID=1938954 RepID=A0A261Y5K8_9FUNG|nr:hypothetical protein BZG36_01175 [Bifiguratus adelaidae]